MSSQVNTSISLHRKIWPEDIRAFISFYFLFCVRISGPVSVRFHFYPFSVGIRVCAEVRLPENTTFRNVEEKQNFFLSFFL